MNSTIETSYALQDAFSGHYLSQSLDYGLNAVKSFTKNLEKAWLAPLHQVQEYRDQQEHPELYEIIEVDKITTVEFVARPTIN